MIVALGSSIQIAEGLYGYIVAGDPKKSIAYIIPAYQAFTEIEPKMGSEVTFPSLDEISGLKNNPQDFDADVEAIPAPWADYVAFAFGHCGLEELPCEYLQKASETYEYCSVLESTSLVFVSSVWGHATKSSRSRSTGFTTHSRRFLKKSTKPVKT